MTDGNFYNAVVSAAIAKVLVVAAILLIAVSALSFGAGYYFGQPKQKTTIWEWIARHKPTCKACQNNENCPEFDRVFQASHGGEIYIDEKDEW